MIDDVLQDFHPSTRRVLKRWLDCDMKQARVMRFDMAKRFPAYALSSPSGAAHPRACVLWLCDYPMEKIRKAARIKIGHEVPASRLRIKMGRKWPRVVVVNPNLEDEI